MDKAVQQNMGLHLLARHTAIIATFHSALTRHHVTTHPPRLQLLIGFYPRSQLFFFFINKSTLSCSVLFGHETSPSHSFPIQSSLIHLIHRSKYPSILPSLSPFTTLSTTKPSQPSYNIPYSSKMVASSLPFPQSLPPCPPNPHTLVSTTPPPT